VKEEDYSGNFIVVEGSDGAGTTTQAKKLAEELNAYYTFQPADNKIGEKVDELISSDNYSPEAIALAFAADRMVHLEEEIIPRLKNGETVICDRYYHSSICYQSAMGLEEEWIKILNKYALTPDITFILSVKASTGMKRVKNRGEDDNIFENLSFQEEVIERYSRLDEDLDEEIIFIDSSKSLDKVFSDIKAHI